MKTPTFLVVCCLFLIHIVYCDDVDDQRDGPVPDEQTETVLDSDTTDRPTEPVPQTGLERDCRVNSFQLQPNFNLARFQGYWYSMSITRYWMAIPSWLPVRQANVQINYKLQSDGTIQLLTGKCHAQRTSPIAVTTRDITALVVLR